MDQIEEIKRKTDIVSFISEYVELKKAGRNFKGLCPFHSEKTPSFIVSPELQIFKCFGCGVGGDAYKFLMEYEKIDFGQALKILAQKTGIKLKPTKGFQAFGEKEELYKLNGLVAEVYHYLLISHKVGEAARSYIKNRKISKDAVETFKLGFAPNRQDTIFKFLTQKKGYQPALLEKAGLVIKNQNQFFDRFRARIMFPLKDHLGNVLGFAGRVIADQGDIAKYINSPETLIYKKGSMLYGLDSAKEHIKKEGFTVVVEGELDCIASWQAGVANVVAIKGSALTEDQAILLSRYCTRINLGLDSDLAGDQAARRGAEIAQKEGLEVRVIDLAAYKDPDQMAQKDPKAWQKAVKNAQGVYDFLIDSVFKKFNSKTTEGKAKISKDLSPILAGIEDEIVKAHCIKNTATRLGVSEEAVAGQVEKALKRNNFSLPTRGLSEEIEKPEKRRLLLEKYLLTVLFQTNPSLLKDKNIQTLIQSPAPKRLVEQFNVWRNQNPNKKFEPASFSNNLPGELVDLFATILLADVKNLPQPSDTEKEIKNISKALEIVDAREKIGKLTEEIKELEAKNDTEKINILETQLVQISGKLAELETAQ